MNARASLSRPSVVLLALFFVSCGGADDSPPAPTAEAPRVVYYEASAGGLSRSEVPSCSVAADVPWPRALRVACLAGRGDALYAGINGFGVARFKGGSIEPELIGDAAFASLTIGSMHALKGGLVVLLYLNTAFDSSASSSPSAILELPLDAKTFQESSIPSSAEGFQAVHLTLTDDGSWAVEYKKASPARVEWLRKRFLPDGSESPLSESEYRAIAESASQFDVSAFAAGHHGKGLIVADLDAGRQRVSLPPDPDGEFLVACLSGSSLSLLNGDEVIDAATGSIRAHAPGLPEGFHYTALSRAGDYWVASYEEGAWPFFGASGLVLFR